MQRTLHLTALAIAIASCLAGAVLSVLPALVVAIVNLFYNSAGGVLILLGSLISLLPHPTIPTHGSGSALPAFQTLSADTGTVLLRSVAATLLCSIATAVILTTRPERGGRAWLTVGGSCALAGIAGGRLVASVLIPAIAVSLLLAIPRLGGRNV